MDFGTPARTAPIGNTSPVPRADVVAVQGSVGVDLPPEKTVQSAQAGDAVRVDIQQRDAKDPPERQAKVEADRAQTRSDDSRAASRREQDVLDDIVSRVVIEPQTRTVVIQKRDQETGETVELVPDEATLKLRIYARRQAEQQAATAEGRYVERTA